MRKWYSIGQTRQYVRVGMPEEEKTECVEKYSRKLPRASSPEWKAFGYSTYCKTAKSNCNIVAHQGDSYPSQDVRNIMLLRE